MSNYQHVIESLTLIPAGRGAFELSVDGELIYSKRSMQRRHAEPGEILEMFRQIVGPDVPTYPRDA